MSDNLDSLTIIDVLAAQCLMISGNTFSARLNPTSDGLFWNVSDQTPFFNKEFTNCSDAPILSNQFQLNSGRSGRSPWLFNRLTFQSFPVGISPEIPGSLDRSVTPRRLERGSRGLNRTPMDLIPASRANSQCSGLMKAGSQEING